MCLEKSFKNIQQKFKQNLSKIFGKKIPKKIVVAVSGGIDSMALLFLLKNTIKSEIFAVTIDHKLRNNSSHEAKFVTDFLKKHQINHTILESYLSEKPSSNIEAEAREVRYNLLVNFCLDKKINHLFIGHHQNDLAENFLIRLFRGSGIDGLASLDYISDFESIKLVRPLLDFEKNELENYLKADKIPHIFDESNDDKKYLRNKIRQFLNTLDDSKLINQRIALASKSILVSKKLIEDEMLKNASEIIEFSELGYFLINIAKFKSLHEEKAQRYLAWILMEVSGNIYKPRLEKLNNFYNWVINDKNYKAFSFYGCISEKYSKEKIIIYREKSKINYKNITIWDNRFLIKNKLPKDISITTISSSELNQIIKTKKIKLDKAIFKKTLYTLPILRKNGEIISIPYLKKFGTKKLEIKFQLRTPLRKIFGLSHN